MSIILVGSTSGSVTLQEPAVAGTTVLDLPAVSGTLITTGSSGQSIPKAALPTGSVLQVVNATTSTQTSANSGTWVDTTLTATITPTSASSKILVIVSQVGCGKHTNDVTLQLRLLRDSTDLIRFESVGGWTGAGGANFIGSCATNYLDSPATTSAITYKTQMSAFSPVATVYTQFNVGAGAGVSTITLMEIAA